MSNVTAAVSAAITQQVFEAVVHNAKFETTGHSDHGAISLSYDVAFHFPDDATAHPFFELRDDGSLYLHDLEIFWDKLELTVGVSIPQVCFGGECIIPNPFDGCWVRLPGPYCVFGGHPDFSFTLALDGFVTTKVLTIEAGFQTTHWTNPNRLPTDDDWTAHQNHRANEWRLGVQRPRIVDIAPIDVGDTVANLFKKAIEDNIASALSWLPQFIIDGIMDLLGGIDWLIRETLGLGDNIALWIEGVFNEPGGLRGLIETLIADYFANKLVITITEDPSPLPPIADPRPAPIGHPNQSLIPILVPVAALGVTVNSHEIVLEGSLG